MNIKWNEYTWYSKMAAIILFLGLVPMLAFYIGYQFEVVRYTYEKGTLGHITYVKRVHTNQKERMLPFENKAYGLSFQYPSSLYVKETEYGVNKNPEYSIELVKNIKENIDFVEGNVTEEMREGPTSILVQIYANPKKLSAKDWMSSEITSTIGNSSSTPIQIAGEAGIMYTWSGLYEGKSYVVTYDDKIYSFSVTWMDSKDQIVRDFDMVINSVSFQ